MHGSTAVNTGFGVVAANGAAPADGSAAPKALALASLGAQVQFLTPGQVAAAAGIANYPRTVGPSAGTHSPGELYVDDGSADATFDPAAPFSSVNWDAAGQTRANMAVVRLGSATPATERAVKFTAGGGGSTHLIVDLLGYDV